MLHHDDTTILEKTEPPPSGTQPNKNRKRDRHSKDYQFVAQVKNTLAIYANCFMPPRLSPL